MGRLYGMLSDVSIFDTAVGVIVALAVNHYLPREKVVPLWEGFKARISGKSAKITRFTVCPAARTPRRWLPPH